MFLHLDWTQGPKNRLQNREASITLKWVLRADGSRFEKVMPVIIAASPQQNTPEGLSEYEREGFLF